ncbi:MAG: hypothetical protein IPI67_22860 [Myxococcales bacterium]|nr:hypothetical protein [Myxococcales bacterium]
MSLNGKKTGSLLKRCVRAGLVGLGLISVACLDRPVSPASPNTTNVFVQDIRQSTVDKIDLLFMIDNSISMADKQAILSEAVPQLLNRLITPAKDPATGKEEFKPVVDIHIGVVSSSLGGHGGDQCSETGPASNPTQYDNAHLIGTIRPSGSLQSYNNLGFLWWDPTGTKGNAGPGEGNAGNLEANFKAHVKATGENGCGYEAQLESWYRFLVDPAPPSKVVTVDNIAQIQGVDDVVLQQRRDFLRPDSLVAIIMLSDENDCSIIDGGFNWIASQTSNPNNTAFHLPRGTSACATDPDSACCRSCNAAEGSPPSGCGDLGSDPECQKGPWDDQGDHPNLRCWEQKKRFGLEFLYPSRRYVEALSQSRICPTWDANGPVGCQFDDPNQGGYRACNPLYVKDLNDPASCETGTRDPALVYIAGIVGVPWHDIATDDTLNDPAKLKYLTATEIAEKGRWDWLLPQCKETVDQNKGKNPGNKLPRPIAACDKWDLKDPPDDALMIESSLPRTGTALALNIPLVDPAGGELANAINGHEWNTADGDLQYACIFKLGAPKNCGASSGGGCDCDDVGTGYTANNPLCQGGGTYSKSQQYAKAFPGTRELQVLKDYGANSIVASICPKVTSGSPTDSSFGYNPAVEAIIERLKEVLSGQCVNRPIAFPPGADGKPDPSAIPQCAVVEVQPSGGAACPPCDGGLNRTDVDAALVKPVINRLKQTGQCTGNACTPASYCMCTINFVQDKNDCEQNENTQAGTIGWCYIDPAQGIGNPALVAGCSPPRQLRFVGSNTPTSGSTVFIACLGAPIANAAPTP